MKKQLFILIVLQGFFLVAFSQSGDLMIKSGEKGYYLEHKTAPKESFFSIGRLYNVNPRFLSAYNALDITKGLNIGQVLRIPLTDTNYSRQAGKGAPVFYRVAEQDNLSKISSTYKVTLNNLRKWNSIAGDKIAAGQKLIVGFLTSGELAKPKEMIIKEPEPVVVKKEEPGPVIADTIPEKVELKTEPAEQPKEEMKKPEPVFIAIKEEPGSGEGFFKTHFYRQLKVYPQSKEMLVTSGIFSTTSGWQDKKYYLLMDNVEPGTIVKITNPANNKSVYAKVLYGMEGIRQNLGYDIRISNAAATALDIAEQDKFVVKVNY
jgi:LysM repeat protein